MAQYKLSDYNIGWTSPSTDESGNMPLGNGSLGSNIWMDGNGDLLMYLSRNDSHSELQRLLKLGRVRISFSPNPFKDSTAFLQKLDLASGSILLEAGKPGRKISLRIFIHSASPVMYIAGASEQAVNITITQEGWRKEKHELNEEELASTWVYREGVPAGIATWESADTILHRKNAIGWFHRNAYSCVPVHIREQHMTGYTSLIKDPILNNTFGCIIQGKNFVTENDTTLQTTRPLKQLDIRMAGYCDQTASRGEWEDALNKTMEQSPAPVLAAQQTKSWWKAFWERSWMYVSDTTANMEGKQATSQVTQSYVLGKYQLACQMRNRFPVRFQGGFFNVDPKYAFYGPDVRNSGYSADYRFYGVTYWWQNVRFIYQPQYAQGNFDMMQPFFNFYFRQIPALEASVSAHYKAKGICIPEMISVFGLPGMGDFGFGKNEYSEIYTRNIWQQCLEMTVMMLDYYHYTSDTAFLKKYTLSWAEKSLEFYRTRFGRDSAGKLLITPTHALETYWTDVVNDMPSVAGLHFVLQELLHLPSTLTTEEERKSWTAMQALLPSLPRKKDADGGFVVDNAERYEKKRSNNEAPDLYCLYPFRLYRFGRADSNEVIKAYKRMPNPGRVCWYQTGIFAAKLHFAADAEKDIIARSAAHLKGFRFPGYMDSPHDWKPDYDGSGNMMNTMQEMLMQCEGNKIYLFPAWPLHWNVHFRLNAYQNTIVQGVFENGKLKDLQVWPTSRRKDIQIMIPVK